MFLYNKVKKIKHTRYIYAKIPRCFRDRYSETPCALLRGRVNNSKSSMMIFWLQNHWGEDYLFLPHVLLNFRGIP